MGRISPYRRQLLEGKAVQLYKQGLTIRMVAQALKGLGIKRSPAWVYKVAKKHKLSTSS